jgi:predicted anti-sigma-YlaC factor YlaD
MSCTFDTRQYVEYLTGELEERERVAFEEHLPACVRCRAEIEAYSRMLQGLETLPQHEPPAGLTEAIVRAAIPKKPPRRRSATAWERVLAVVAAQALIVSFILSTRGLLERAGVSAWNNISPGLSGAIEVGREGFALLTSLSRVLSAIWNLVTTVGAALNEALIQTAVVPPESILLFFAFMLLTIALLWRIVGHPFARTQKEVN